VIQFEIKVGYVLTSKQVRQVVVRTFP